MLQFIKTYYHIFKNSKEFFRYSLIDKADFLKSKHLYEAAGNYYLKTHHYSEAISCFKVGQAYHKLILAYEKAGLISDAIYACEYYHHYKLGTLICKRNNNILKMAYFYSYFEPLVAAKYYKKSGLFFESMICYLKGGNIVYAIDAIMRSKDPIQYQLGISCLSEFAVTLYFNKDYKQALKIFVEIFDYQSALQCAKKLNDSFAIGELLLLVANDHICKGNIELANTYKDSAAQYLPHSKLPDYSLYA